MRLLCSPTFPIVVVPALPTVVVDVIADAVVVLVFADDEACPVERESIICWIHCCCAGLNCGKGCEVVATTVEAGEVNSKLDDITHNHLMKLR